MRYGTEVEITSGTSTFTADKDTYSILQSPWQLGASSWFGLETQERHGRRLRIRFKVEVMTMPTADTVIWIAQKFLHDDVNVDMISSLCAESESVRKAAQQRWEKNGTEVAVFANTHNLDQEDSHGMRVLVL